jgi:hypothetical protein
MRLGQGNWLVVGLFVSGVGACSGQETPTTGTGGAPSPSGGSAQIGGTGGNPVSGGNSSVGGQLASGGSPASGGSTTGGSSTGGTRPTGGSTTGGSATGGSATGGARPTGGSATGGTMTGGTATGGSATGGVRPSGGSAGQPGTGGTSGCASWWKPTAGTTWQWQIGGGTIDPNLAVQVFDIDWEQSASIVQSLHAAGKKVICYVSVGSWEDWRPDAASFPAAVLGNNYPGWPGERFVDIRAQALRDVMAARFDVCKSKGFDAVEPDNMDVFENSSGFPLTQADGVNYALWLSTQMHQRCMGIVQKNASGITASIQASYDGALTEDCYAGGWCSDMQPYINANKPVFVCEYDSSVFSAACSWGKPRSYSPILKELDLGAWIQFCP